MKDSKGDIPVQFTSHVGQFGIDDGASVQVVPSDGQSSTTRPWTLPRLKIIYPWFLNRLIISWKVSWQEVIIMTRIAFTEITTLL